MSQQKAAIVTGASRGIGAAIAERLAQEGFAIVINYAGNIAAAQKAFFHRAHMNGLAAQGKWRAELEKQAA